MKLCRWCQAATLTDPRAIYCSRLCRQSAFRLRRRHQVDDASRVTVPLRFAYADPPYPGKAARFYADQPTFAGEVDHAALVVSLTARGYAGWALSTSAEALRALLPLCPPDVRVCAWTKPHAVPPATRGIHGTWEPVIVWGGRQRPPGVADHLRAYPARGGGDLPGRKPLAFAAWLFDLLGMAPGDHLDDLFPGSGIIGRAWHELSARFAADPSPGAPDDGRRFASLLQDNDASPSADDDGPAKNSPPAVAAL